MTRAIIESDSDSDSQPIAISVSQFGVPSDSLAIAKMLLLIPLLLMVAGTIGLSRVMLVVVVSSVDNNKVG